jgi:hypothetical protein
MRRITRYIIDESDVTPDRPKPAHPAASETPDGDAVLAQLDRVLSTSLFQHSKRYPAFLRHVVEQALRGTTDELKERTLGISVFRRSPEYDTSADPVVRNTASEVRKRLDQYYSDPAHSSELRITLPAGAYVPEFRTPSGQTRPVSVEPSPRVTGARRPWWAPLAFGAVALIGLIGVVAGLPKETAITLFWAPIIEAAEPVLVVTDTLVGLEERRPESDQPPRLVREIVDPKVFLSVNQESAKLASFLGSQGKNIEHELARNVTLANLRARPFILRGAFNNRWTQRAVAPFRFYFQLDRDPLVRRIVDRQYPDRRDWAAPMKTGLAEDYALIARAPEPETGQMMLVIAGLSEKGSAAALEFVTRPKYLERFAAQAPAGWEKRNIELVIKTNIVNDEWGEPRVVAWRLW